jgi:hypothetical protein
MAASVPPQPPTPERFFNAVNAYEQTEALKAAIESESRGRGLVQGGVEFRRST